MDNYFRVFFVLLFFLISSISVHAQETTESLPAPWSLSQGWWQRLLDLPREEEELLNQWLESLRDVEQQVPTENQDFVRTAIDRLSLNLQQFLKLRGANGWTIAPSPEFKDSYSIAELLSAAKQVKIDQRRYQEAENGMTQFLRTLDRVVRQKDSLYERYGAADEKSLQRTLIGLDLMIVRSNEAIIEERIRIKEEEKIGIEQSLRWSEEVLEVSRNRLALSSIDVAELERSLQQRESNRQQLEEELLELETGLAVADEVAQTDTRPFQAINKRVMLSRIQLEGYSADALKGLVKLADPDLNHEAVRLLVDSSADWRRFLRETEEKVSEWTLAIRQRRAAAESIFLQDPEDTPEGQGSRYRDLLSLTRVTQEALGNIGLLELELFQTGQLVNLLNTEGIKNLGWVQSFWERIYYYADTFLTDIAGFLSFPLFRINENPVSILRIAWAVIILILAFSASSGIRRLLMGFGQHKAHISKASLYTFNRVTHYVILSVGIVWALSYVGVDFSSLLIIAGALSVGIGFGLRGIVNNFLGGLIVLFDRKLRVGDYVELSNGEVGHLKEVNPQNTVIRTPNGHDLLVPNSEMISRELKNWTLRDPFVRLNLPFGVAYGSDKEKVAQVITEAALKVTQTVSGHGNVPDPTVRLMGFGDSALDFELVVWVNFRACKMRQSALKAKYYWEMETALREHAIEIPFPQRDIHVKSKEVQKEEL